MTGAACDQSIGAMFARKRAGPLRCPGPGHGNLGKRHCREAGINLAMYEAIVFKKFQSHEDMTMLVSKESATIERISDLMTMVPKTIEPHQSVLSALAVMDHGRFHHLPVCSGGRVVGVVSERDLSYLLSLQEVESNKAVIADIMIPEPVVVGEGATLKEALYLMKTQKVGSVIVTDTKQKVLGIFTAQDAIEYLFELI